MGERKTVGDQITPLFPVRFTRRVSFKKGTNFQNEDITSDKIQEDKTHSGFQVKQKGSPSDRKC